MIDNTVAMKQCQRLAGLDRFPYGDEAKAELVKALRTADRDEDAKDFVTDWLLRNTQCPKPAEIRAALKAVSETPFETVPTACEECGDTGYRPLQIVKNGVTYDAAVPCTCGRAPKLAAVVDTPPGERREPRLARGSRELVDTVLSKGAKL